MLTTSYLVLRFDNTTSRDNFLNGCINKFSDTAYWIAGKCDKLFDCAILNIPLFKSTAHKIAKIYMDDYTKGVVEYDLVKEIA